MRKEERGISVGRLLIIVFIGIILITLIFVGEKEVEVGTEFGKLVEDFDALKKGFLTEGVLHLMGEEATKNNNISKSQAYNYLAKGATTKLVPNRHKEKAWLTKAQADALPCTRIEPESAKEAIGVFLPKRSVETVKSKSAEVSYFVTNRGDIFMWPPFYNSEDERLYINDTMVVKGTKVNSGDWTIYIEDEAEMYKNGFTFMVNGVEIKIQADGHHLPEITPETSPEEIRSMPSISYKDKRNPKPAKGIEYKW